MSCATTNRVSITLSISALTALLVATDAAGSGSATPAPAPPTWIVIGIDRTDSYAEMTRPAIRLARRLVGQVGFNTRVSLRWVSDRSYANDQLITRSITPSAPIKPHNVWDGRAQAAYLAEIHKIDSYRDGLQRSLDAVDARRPGNAPRTDLWGFLTAASEELAEAPENAIKVVYVLTDLNDNTRYQVRPSLKDVDVVVFTMRNDLDPSVAISKRERWKAELERCNVRSVRFATGEVSASDQREGKR